MSMKKNKLFIQGYTLAETLITLAVIGVIAAAVVPQTFEKVASKKISQNLLKTYELVQNGMKNVMASAAQNNMEADFTTLDGILISDILGNNALNANKHLIFDDNGNALFTRTSFATGAQSADVEDYNVITYQDNPISEIYQDFNAWNKYQFKNNNKSIIIVQPISENDVNNYGGIFEQGTVLTRLFIDANGTDVPNKLGKDVFMFGLANNGQLIPAGSYAYNKNVYSEDISEVDMTQQPLDLEDGRGCAAVVMAKGWEIKY